MKLNQANKIVIVGAGLVGSLLAIYMKNRGYKVVLLEKRPDLRQAEHVAGRSINLALSNRGLKALKEVGLEDEVRKLAIPMKGRQLHDENGTIGFQPYGKEGQYINSVSRGGLNWLLLNQAEKLGVETHFNLECVSVDFENTVISLRNLDSGDLTSVKSDVLFGTDGAFSAVREAMMKSGRFNYNQFYLDHGYKELSIEPTKNGDFAMEPNALHIWPRGQYMLIALPNLDRSFTCTLFYPFRGPTSFETLNSEDEVNQFFQEKFPDVPPLMPSLTEDFFQNPTSSLVTVKCMPWAKNNSLIMGDAAHAIVPFYGQGMNAGFEDCHILNQLMDNSQLTWEELFQDFQSNRKPDADAIADLAISNFIEMRDKVADEMFLLRKKIERKLNENYPDKWIPLYSMVTFSDLGYSEALTKGKIQESIMDSVMNNPNINQDWDKLNLEEIVSKLDQ